jgi:hypothetical protein
VSEHWGAADGVCRSPNVRSVQVAGLSLFLSAGNLRALGVSIGGTSPAELLSWLERGADDAARWHDDAGGLLDRRA